MRPILLFLIVVLAAALAAPLLLTSRGETPGPTNTTATTTTATTTEPVQRTFSVELLRAELNYSSPSAEFYVPLLPTADWVKLYVKAGPLGYDPYPVSITIRDLEGNILLGPWGVAGPGATVSRWLGQGHLGKSYVVETVFIEPPSNPNWTHPAWYIEIWIEYGVRG